MFLCVKKLHPSDDIFSLEIASLFQINNYIAIQINSI